MVRCGVPCVGLRFLLYVFTVFCCMCLWCGVVGVLGGGCVMVVATMWCVCVMVCTALPPHMPMCNECCVCARWHTSHRAMPMGSCPHPHQDACCAATGCDLRKYVQCTCCCRPHVLCCRMGGLRSLTDRPAPEISLLYVCGLEGTDAMV